MKQCAMSRSGPTSLLALLFLGLLVGWVGWTPYHPDRVARAIPAKADVVSWHEAPGERWPEWTRNPLVLEGLSEILGPESARATAGRPLPGKLRGLTSDRVMLARARPEFGSDRNIWFGAAWAGSRARLLRWQLKLFPVSGIRAYGTHGGRPLYRVEIPGPPPGHVLTLTFEEGLALVCLSEDVHDIRSMLDAYDGLLPSLRDLSVPVSRAVPDAVRVRGMGGSEEALSIRFSHLTESRTELRAEGSLSAEIPVVSRLEKEDRQGPPWGDIPEVALVVSPDLLRRVPIPPEGWFLRTELEELLDAWGAPPVLTLGIFGGSFTGRFRSVRVPGLVLAFQTERSWPEVEASVHDLLDRINAQRQWGLISVADPGAPTPLRRIMGTAPNAFGALQFGEYPAFTLKDRHFLLASNAETLMRLLEADAGPSRVPDLPGNGEGAAVRMDLQRAASTLRLMYGSYVLYQIMDRREPDPGAQVWMDGIGQRLPSLERLGEVDLQFRGRPPRWETWLKADHPPAP